MSIGLILSSVSGAVLHAVSSAAETVAHNLSLRHAFPGFLVGPI
jgi:hypothetical protein